MAEPVDIPAGEQPIPVTKEVRQLAFAVDIRRREDGGRDLIVVDIPDQTARVYTLTDQQKDVLVKGLTGGLAIPR